MIFKPKIKNYKILGIHPFYIWFNQNRIQIVEKRPYKNPAWNHKKTDKNATTRWTKLLPLFP